MRIRTALLALALVSLISACAIGQTYYAVAPIPKLLYLTNSGAIAPGYKVCTYAAGTTTPQATFSDKDGTPNTNPVTLDSAGRANIWINSNAYKFMFYAPGTGNTCNGSQVGTLLWTVDGIRDYGLVALSSGAVTGSGSAGKCAQWATSSTLEDTSTACGTLDGSGTEGVVPLFTGTNAIGDSFISQDTDNSRVIVDADQAVIGPYPASNPAGKLVVDGSVTVVNANGANAQIGQFYATGGADGAVTIYSTAGGTAPVKPIKLIIDPGDTGFEVGTDLSITMPGLAAPSGQTCTLKIDDTGKLAHDTCM